MLLSFDKPNKINSTQEHNATYSSDSGIDGTYVPNMSHVDMLLWKAVFINKGKANARIEIRKTFKSAQVLIIVALDGWNYKNEYCGGVKPQKAWGWTVPTDGLNVRISMNGPLLLTFEQFAEFQAAIDEAKEKLNEQQKAS